MCYKKKEKKQLQEKEQDEVDETWDGWLGEQTDVFPVTLTSHPHLSESDDKPLPFPQRNMENEHIGNLPVIAYDSLIHTLQSYMDHRPTIPTYEAS